MGSFYLMLATMTACVQWWQIIYRLRLFFGEYRGQPWINHIGDGDFAIAYAINALMVTGAVFAARVFRNERALLAGAVALGILHLLGWGTLVVMHRTGTLVEYHEFIRYMKRG